jgi:GTPase SAR1 family protein
LVASTDPKSLTKFAGLDIIAPTVDTKRGGVYVIYGQGGVGKTTAVADLATSKFVERGTAWANMDAGEDSIIHLIRQGVIQNLPMDTWAQLEKFTNAYVNEQPWDLVCIDNLSEGQSKDLAAITNGNKPEIQDYGVSQAHVLSLVRKWVNIAKHNGILVFILMWQQEVKNERTGVIKNDIYLTKKLAEAMGGVVGV